MKNILCLNKIAKIGTDKLDKKEYNVGTEVENPDAIIVLSRIPSMLAIET